MSSEIGVKPKREKFFIIQNIIIDEWGPVIASDGVAVYCLLARKANSETGIAWMGQDWIADRLGLSVATVGTVLGDLEDLGLITVERQRDPATGRVKRSLYTLVDPVPSPTIKVEDAPRFKRIEQRKSKRASMPTTNRLDKSNLNGSDKTTLNDSVSPQLTVTEYKDSLLDKDVSTNSDSLDAATQGDDLRSYLQTLGLQGNALDNLCYKATMDGIGPAHIAALLDAARADFAARRAEFNAVAFLSVYPYRGGWTYQPPAPKRPAPAQSYSPPPPDFVTHQEVVTSRPLAEPPVFERSTKTREERAEMRRRAFIEQREKLSHGRITAA